MGMKFDISLMTSLDGIDIDRYIVGIYYVEFPKDVSCLEKAEQMAIDLTTGTWTAVAGETKEMREKYGGKVVGVYEIPDYEFGVPREVQDARKYVICLAIPVENIGNQLPLMLTVMIGDLSLMGNVRLLDIIFPKSYIKRFKGPKFGVSGLRNFINVHDRPLLLNMIKPCLGFTPEFGAELLYKAAVGGVDIIKDDELLTDVDYNRVEDRVVKYMEAVDKAKQEKGEETIYAINITNEVDKMLELADKVIELGGNGLMVNFLVTGLSALRVLAEDPSIKVPILAHLDLAGVLYGSPTTGMSSHLVLGKLPRIAGADIIVVPNIYGYLYLIKEKYLKIGTALLSDYYHIKKTWPALGGGTTPRHVPLIVNDFGKDVIIAAGGGIHGHPMGATAGAKAFRQAIDAVMKGIPLEEYAKEHSELDAALKAFG